MRGPDLSLIVSRSHEAEELRNCDYIVMLREGEIIAHVAR